MGLGSTGAVICPPNIMSALYLVLSSDQSFLLWAELVPIQALFLFKLCFGVEHVRNFFLLWLLWHFCMFHTFFFTQFFFPPCQLYIFSPLVQYQAVGERTRRDTMLPSILILRIPQGSQSHFRGLTRHVPGLGGGGSSSPFSTDSYVLHSPHGYVLQTALPCPRKDSWSQEVLPIDLDFEGSISSAKKKPFGSDFSTVTACTVTSLENLEQKNCLEKLVWKT